MLHPRWSSLGKAAACIAVCIAYGGLALYALLSGVPSGITHDTANALAIINAITFAAALSVLALIAAKVTGEAETGLLRATAALKELSSRDPLTGLLNRRAMTELLCAAEQQARTSGEPYALVLVDIDCFKRINDAYGHATGDAVIGAVAAALQGALRNADHVARWGGEEFLALLPTTSLTGATQAAEKMARAVRELPVAADDGRGVPVTATFGVAEGGSGRDSAATIRAADDALYHGKRNGRDRVTEAPPRHDPALART